MFRTDNAPQSETFLNGTEAADLNSECLDGLRMWEEAEAEWEEGVRMFDENRDDEDEEFFG